MISSRLTQLDFLPDGLTEASPKQLYKILPQPTLIHLPGRDDRPLFISALLHGNEPTSLFAVQALLKKYSVRDLPRSLSIFFGNVQAAAKDVRRLDSQPDFNRVWPGSELPSSPEHILTQEVVDEMAARNVFASADIHNNTGLNPHYACVNKLDHQFIQLASLFGRMVVYFIRPKGVQSAAFAQYCPSVTLECGKAGQTQGIRHALEYLDCCLHLSEIPSHPVAAQDIDLFHTVAQVTVPEHITFSFTHNNVNLALGNDLDHMNFTEIPAGTGIGQLQSVNEMPVVAINEFGKEVTHDYFYIDKHTLTFQKNVMPSMLTLDEEVIRQDCLCYIMERISV